VAVTMFSPVGSIGSDVDGGDPAPGAEGTAPAGTGAGDAGDAGGPGDAGEEAGTSLRVLTDAPPSESVIDRGDVAVPPLTAVVIGVTVAFTIVFGIIPGPILDFAHHATLLFT